MTSGERAVDRRWVLGTIGIGAAAGLAGCLGDDDDDDTEGIDDGDDNRNGDEANGDESTLSEPVDFPEDEDEGECAVCSMVAAEYPDWNAQVVHEDGHREYMCSKGCLTAYYFAPEKFTSGDPDEEIAGVWATCFLSGELIDATEAYFVYEQDRDRQDFPMPMGSPLAFSDREDAVSYVEDYDDLNEDDHVITLEDVDREVAEFYREPRLEEMSG
ncbi:nitrous oxide reductase accessory protein NosL [Natronorubrum bangense]|uniref:Lipoprotein n=2 Tax=Natronorubrum bangense TaxID=61858 RepID=L9WLK2_9EURY|nr:nitrous oxide reductase accessory protein NosL [Natronorubrum bangense]ELY49233.1 lipoprotein [Natronorubrum bangense JCM 10635]QCC57023.1 hypothetical protein DV706_21100 [Natronorubrum bangense]